MCKFRKKKYLLKINFFLVCVLAFICSPILEASGPVSPALKIIPSRVELLIEPRGREVQSINISNYGTEELTLTAHTSDWNIDETGKLVLLEQGDSERSASAWLRFNPREFSIPSGKTQIIRFSVSLPPEVEPGEYRMAVVLETKERYEVEENIFYRPVYALLVYINVPEVERRGEVKELKIIEESKGNYLLEGEIASSGNAHLRVEGIFNLKDEEGLIVNSKMLGKRVVLPGKKEAFQILIDEEISSGEYTAEIIWKYQPAFYMKGKLAEYPSGERELIKKIKFKLE
ncbi:MAG TPA: hypothetical protein VKY40_07960 [Halanaerobiales bacterium]|nr:hypothetical protein [Halanaerobiales bacterium]